MNQINRRTALAASLVACGWAWVQPVWADEYDDTLALFKKEEQTGKFFSTAYGYAVFPRILKGAIGALGAQPLLVAGPCELPHAVEEGPALTVQLLDRHHGELPVLGIDPAASAHGQGAKDQHGQQTRQQFRIGHGCHGSGVAR